MQYFLQAQIITSINLQCTQSQNNILEPTMYIDVQSNSRYTVPELEHVQSIYL